MSSTETVRKRLSTIGQEAEQFSKTTQSNVYRPWYEETPLDNIRYTAFRGERTGYTYGESGSYRSDRLNLSWRTPDMSRLPLGFKDSKNSSRTTEVTMKSVSVVATRMHMTDDGCNTMSNKYSDASLTYSQPVDSRVLRSVTKRTHNSVGNFSREQRNLNSSVSLDSGRVAPDGETSETSVSVSTNRSRRSRKSDRTLTKVHPTDVHSSANDDHHTSTRLSPPHLSSTSSTYVYTYVPPTRTDYSGIPRSELSLASPPVSGDGPAPANSFWGKSFSSVWFHSSKKTSTNDSHEYLHTTRYSYSTGQSKINRNQSRGWLTRFIFGLPKPTGSASVSADVVHGAQFVSSDIDDDEGLISPSRRSTARSRHMSSRNSQQRAESDPNKSYPLLSGRLLSVIFHSCLWLLNAVRDISIQILAFLLALIYALAHVGTSLVDWLPRVGRWLMFRLVRNTEQTGTHHMCLTADVYPHMGKFQDRTIRNILYQNTGLNNSFEPDSNSQCSYCWRFIMVTCLLIPLILLLTFLVAPVEENSPNVLGYPFVIADTDCQTKLAETIPTRSSLWKLINWRAKCLFTHYITRSLTEIHDSSNENPQEPTRWWWPFWNFQQTSLHDSYDFKPTLKLDSDIVAQLTEQLAALSHFVNKRFDLLSGTLQSTEDRITSVAQLTHSQADKLNVQFFELRNQFNQHLSVWEKFQSSLKNPDLMTDSKAVTGIPTESFMKAMLAATNETITQRINALREQIMQDQLILAKRHNASIVHLSLLFASLRGQLTHRFKETGQELIKLRLQLKDKITNQPIKSGNSEAELLEIRSLIDRLLLRLYHLEQLNNETESTFSLIKDELRSCKDAQAQMNATACDNISTAAMGNYSQAFIEQTENIITEVLSKELVEKNWDLLILSKINEVLPQLSKQTLETWIHEHRIDLVSQFVMNETVFAKLIDEALQRFAADRTGLADFALESAGGSIVGTRCTRTYTEGASLFSMFGLPLARLSNSPRTMLQPGNSPGDCWPFHGSSGQAVIRLSAPIHITAVSLEHLPRSLAPNGRLDSAPKDFLIKALRSERDEEGEVLGKFMYDVYGSPIQTFTIHNYSKPLQYIEFIVQTNHGHTKYTCVYRLRVHGKLALV